MRLFLSSFAIWIFALVSGAFWSAVAVDPSDEVAMIIVE